MEQRVDRRAAQEPGGFFDEIECGPIEPLAGGGHRG